MSSKNITRRTGLSMAAILASSLERGDSLVVISARSARATKHVDRFQAESTRVERTNDEQIVFVGDMNAVLDNPVDYVGRMLAEATYKTEVILDVATRTSILSGVTTRIAAIKTDGQNKVITQGRVLDMIQRAARGGHQVKGKKWSESGKGWANVVLKGIMNWANGDSKTADSVVGFIPTYVYDKNTLPGKKKLDIAMATPATVYAGAIKKSGKIQIIGTFPNEPMITDAASTFPPFIVVKKGMKIVTQICDLLRQGEIDGNTILTMANGETYSFASDMNVQFLEDYNAFEFLVNLGLAVYHTEGNRKLFDELNNAHVGFKTYRDKVCSALAGIETGVNAPTLGTTRSAFEGLSDELVGAGASFDGGSKSHHGFNA